MEFVLTQHKLGGPSDERKSRNNRGQDARSASWSRPLEADSFTRASSANSVTMSAKTEVVSE
jgi:hypothetical protein